MKKNFLHLVGCVVICLSSLVYAMGEKEFQVGSTVFSCHATNQQLLERLTLNQDGLDQSRLIIPLSENANEAVLEVSSDGELYMGSLEQIKQFCIKDCHGKVKVTKQREQTGDKSFDEASIKEKINRLWEGESLTALFADNNQVTIAFDRLMKLITADGMVFSVQQSKIVNSRLIAEIMRHNKEMTAGEIKLASSGEEIKMFLDFLKSNEEERKKITNNLSTFEHIKLVSVLHYHFLSKKLFSDCWDQLIRKIYNSLKEGDLTWFAEISSLPKDKKERVQGIVREVLNEVIKPASPKVVFGKEGVARCVFSATKNLIGCINNQRTMEIIDLTEGESIIVRSNVFRMEFSQDSTKVTVKYYGDDKKEEIIDLTIGRSIVARSNVEWMELSPDGTKVRVAYNEKEEVIDLATGESIVGRSNVSMKFSPDSTKVTVRNYGDNKKGEIIDLTTGESIVVRSNVEWMELSPDGTKVRVAYDEKEEVIDLATGESIVGRSNVEDMGFSPDSTKVRVRYYGDNKKVEIIDLTTGRSIVVRSNVLVVGFSSDSTKVRVEYFDGVDKKGEIIDLTMGKSIIVRSNVKEVRFSPDSTKVRVEYFDGVDKKGEIIGLTTGRSIVVRSNVEWMELSPDGTKAVVRYYGGDKKVEIIDLTTGRSIVVRSNVLVVVFSSDSTKVRVEYYAGVDKTGEIIDLTTGESSIVVRSYVLRMEFNPDSTKVIIPYFNNKMEIVDLVDCDRGINFALFTPEQLFFVFNLKRDQDYLAKIDKNKAKQIWQSLDAAVQEILEKDYFPEVDLSFDEDMSL